MVKKCSVLIPCLNEGMRIVPIIEEVKKSDFVDEIIVIDDGSDNYTKNILSKIEDIRLIIHTKNFGKGKAISSGVVEAQNELLVFLDGDLRNVKSQDIDDMVLEILKDQADMVLSVSRKDVFYMHWLGFAQAYTGQRIIKKSLLIKHPEIFKQNKYTIEPAINSVFFKNYQVRFIYNNEIKHTYKIQKEGLLGLIKEFDMYYNHIKFLGFKEFISQLKYAKKMCN